LSGLLMMLAPKVLKLGPIAKIFSTSVGAGLAIKDIANIGLDLTSRKEDLATDLKDLYEVLQKADKSANAKEMIFIIKPFINKFSVPLDEKAFQKFVPAFDQMEKIKPKLDRLMARIEIELGQGRWYQAGLNLSTRIRDKYNTFWEVYNETKLKLTEAQEAGKELNDKANNNGQITNKVTELQKILFLPDDPEKVTGKMDLDTIQAAGVLENNIDKALKELGYDYEVKGKIVQNGKINMEVSKLKRLIELIKKAIEEKKSK